MAAKGRFSGFTESVVAAGVTILHQGRIETGEQAPEALAVGSAVEQRVDGEKHKESIQQKMDELMRQDQPVTVSWLDDDGLKKKQICAPEGFARSPSAKEARVVEIGDLGGYPCGGTHAHSTAELNKVVIRKIASAKGNTKISYEEE